MSYQYYLIKQKINDEFYSNVKIIAPVNESLLKKLINTFVGYVQVWLVDLEDNSKENVTSKYGNTKFDLYDFASKYEGQLHKIRVIYKLRGGSTLNEPIYFYTIGKLIDEIPSKFFVADTPCALKVVFHTILVGDYSMIKNHKKKVLKSKQEQSTKNI
jgi:ribosomal protein S17E